MAAGDRYGAVMSGCANASGVMQARGRPVVSAPVAALGMLAPPRSELGDLRVCLLFRWDGTVLVVPPFIIYGNCGRRVP